MKERLVEPDLFNRDLEDFYVSNYLTSELREFYTESEKKEYYKSNMRQAKAKTECKKFWPICYQSLEMFKQGSEKSHYLFKCQFVLSNYKFDYFTKKKNEKKQRSPLVSSFPGVADPQTMVVKTAEDDLLIERQRHVCGQRNEDFHRMMSDLRINILRMVSNETQVEYKRTRQQSFLNVELKDSDPTKPYENFIKKTMVMESNSNNNSFSNGPSSQNKNSNSLSQVNDQCTIILPSVSV